MVVELGNNVQGLTEVLENTSDALSGTRAKIATVQQKIARKQEDISHIDAQLEVVEGLCSEVETAIATAEKRLRQLEASAKVAQGTSLQDSTAADVRDAESDLEFQRQLLESHVADRGTSEKKLLRDRATAEKAIQKLEQEVADLQEQEAGLVAIYKKTHGELGQACFVALSQEIQSDLQRENELKEALHEMRSERLALQSSLAERLAAWPELVNKAEKDIDMLGQEPAPSPTVETLNVAINYLRKLAAHAPYLEGTPSINLNQVELLLSVPTDLVRISRHDPNRIAILSDRISKLLEVVRQVEQAERFKSLYTPEGRRL